MKVFHYLLLEMGRFTIAAKHHQTIAEIAETELADIEKSMQHYELAADYFRGEESNSAANKCMVKVSFYMIWETLLYDKRLSNI